MTHRLSLVALALILTACQTQTIVPVPGNESSSVAPQAMERIAPSSRSSSTAARSSAAKTSVQWNEAEVLASLPKSEAEWKSRLTDDQYLVLRQAGTETPFTSDLVNEHRPGTFVTADCGEPVFRSEQKYDSGTGWPSFWAPISPNAVIEKTDTTGGLERTEILSKCGGHLGHVFTDGPEPTGLRYCMNGLALKFIPD